MIKKVNSVHAFDKQSPIDIKHSDGVNRQRKYRQIFILQVVYNLNDKTWVFYIIKLSENMKFGNVHTMFKIEAISIARGDRWIWRELNITVW